MFRSGKKPEKQTQHIAALTEHAWVSDDRIRFIFEHTMSEYNRDLLQSHIYRHKTNCKEALRYGLIFVGWVIFALCVFEDDPEPIFWVPVLLIFEIYDLYNMTLAAFKRGIRKDIRAIQEKEREDSYNEVCQLILSDEGIQVRCMAPKSVMIAYPYAKKSKIARFFFRGAEVLETEDYFVFCGIGSAFWIKKKTLVKGDINTLCDFLKTKGAKVRSSTIRTTKLENKLQRILAEEMSDIGLY